MPWGLTRFHHSGQSHFVTFCCYHRRRSFTTDASRRIFESALERVRRSFRLSVYGYVVMPEHIHLLLSEPQQDTSSDRTAPLKPKPGLSGPPVLLSEPQQDTLADALKSLKQGVSRRLIGEADHFWQKRYYDFNIRDRVRMDSTKTRTSRGKTLSSGRTGRVARPCPRCKNGIPEGRILACRTHRFGGWPTLGFDLACPVPKNGCTTLS